MPLYDTAYLELEHPDYGTGVFELRHAEVNTSLERQMLLGNRGGLIQSLSDIAPGVDRFGESGASYNIDAGDGDATISLTFRIKADDGPKFWGNGQGGDSPADASGAHPVTKRDVLRYWLRTSRTDSRSPAKLYHGEWSPGRFADESGIFDEPVKVVVLSGTTDWEWDEPSAVSGTIELQRTSSFPEFPSDEIDGIGDILDDLSGDGGDDS